jgi:hypothetical protein
MTNLIDLRERWRNLKLEKVPAHKFELGLNVSCKPGPFAAGGYFRVTRHLPDSGNGLQYRIRSDRDGHERVVTESALMRTT